MKLKVILEPSDEGGFTAYVPSLPGCISEGNSLKEALANIREAIELYLEPVDDDFVTEAGTNGVGSFPRIDLNSRGVVYISDLNDKPL